MSFFKRLFGRKSEAAPSLTAAPQFSDASVKSDDSVGNDTSSKGETPVTSDASEKGDIAVTVQVGERMMLSERGLVSVQSVSSTGDVTLCAEEATFVVAAADIANVLRSIATREGAEAALALVSETPPHDTRSTGERAIAYMRLIENGSLEDRIRALAAIHAISNRTYAEDQSQRSIETLVAAELGAAMGLSTKAAKKRLRAALDPSKPQAAELPDRSKELKKHKKLPKLEGLTPVGAIAIEYEVCVGEWGYSDDKATAWVGKAKPGIWDVYQRPDEQDDEFPAETLAAHHEAVSSLSTIPAWSDVAELPIEGGTMMIADKDATLDDDFQKEREYAGDGIVLGRGSVASLGGDGSCVVAVVAEQMPIEIVRIAYR